MQTRGAQVPYVSFLPAKLLLPYFLRHKSFTECMDNKEDNNNDTQAIIIVTITANYSRLNEWQSPPFHLPLSSFFLLPSSSLSIGKLPSSSSVSLSSSVIAESQSRTTSHLVKFSYSSSPINGQVEGNNSSQLSLTQQFIFHSWLFYFSSLTALLYSILAWDLKKEKRSDNRKNSYNVFTTLWLDCPTVVVESHQVS